ncbi:monooxygenase [Seminavis robusta]|uniref:Monooxygenase n=1 Tax=Seminavis robusta TaxID=568900 RepID=A0A9N8DHA7_9STRA|nr:monooxygenase [Seminavis robusta]|eukprot:Sro90_g047450.1 monooxygenase (701) ;mRNA; r:102165-104267
MLEVAVIGAGASGLVASRQLLRHGVRPCIFEAGQHVGGCWNPSNTATNKGGSYKMWDSLSPNLSKYTCVFSDSPWPDHTPTFPSRTDLQDYLQDYYHDTTTLLEQGEQQEFKFGCTVTQVKRTTTDASSSVASSSSGFTQPFQVEWNDSQGMTQSQSFDGVIVATGFFAVPFLPDCFDELLGNDNNLLMHSSQYRSPSQFANQTVAVVGASFSALEIAADVRKHAANVISILPNIPYVLPRYVGPAFSPLDTVLYRRHDAAPKLLSAESKTPQQKHAFLKGLAGRKQAQQSSLGLPTDTSQPPFVAISDDYLDLVVDGSIHAVKGRVTQSSVDSSNNKIELQVVADEQTTTLSDIDRVIACTGYQSNLDFLEPSILETLEYDVNDMYAPLTLCHDAFHPQIPGLGFVGMYRGPYFGIMELQAKTLAGMMSGDYVPTPEHVAAALEESKSIRQSTPRAQFPRHDYVAFMDTLAQPLGLLPQGTAGAKGAMVTPLVYQSAPNEISERALKNIDQECRHGGSSSVNMAKVALSALIGKWEFDRTITQFNNPSMAPQKVTGVIDFSHIAPSVSSSSDSSNNKWNSVLYNENGIFHVAGKELEVFRQYEYEYKDNGILEIYFVEQGARAHLFLSLKFTTTSTEAENDAGQRRWIATSDHLCIKDLYKGEFQIQFDGISATQVSMTYRVKGPNKDYESVTHLKPHF